MVDLATIAAIRQSGQAGVRKNLDSMTGFRGVAAFVVFLAHFGFYNATPFLRHLKAFLTWHNAAVDIFFVLSGFTLAYVYSDRHFDYYQFKKYFVSRFARIYPLYFASLLGACFLVYPKISPAYTSSDFWIDFLRQLLLVNCWAPIGNGAFFNNPSWSISVEMFCYIFLFPPLVTFYANRKIQQQRLLSLLAPCLMLVSYYVYTCYFRSDLLAFGKHDGVHPFSYYVNILRGIIGFFVGYVIHFSYRNNGVLFRLCRRYADLVFGLALIIMLGQQLQLGPNNDMLVVISPFLCLACASGAGWVNKCLSTRMLVHLGELSYSVYLLHFLVLQFALLWFGPKSGTPAMVIVVYLVSLASYHLYEKPLRSLINGFGIPGGRTSVILPLVKISSFFRKVIGQVADL